MGIGCQIILVCRVELHDAYQAKFTPCCVSSPRDIDSQEIVAIILSVILAYNIATKIQP